MPSSSFGCLVCDPVIAAWYFLGAPDVWRRFRTARPQALAGDPKEQSA